MLCRITNDQPGARVFFDVNLRPVLIAPGKSADIDIDAPTYEDARACALVGVGPKIMLLEKSPAKVAAPVEIEPDEQPDEQIASRETKAVRRKPGRPRRKAVAE